MKFPTSLRIAAILGVFVAGTAQAQGPSCTADSTTTSPGSGYGASKVNPICGVRDSVVATVPHILQLSLTAASTSLGAITDAEFAAFAADSTNPNAWTWTLGPQVTAKGNRPFLVYARAGSATWTYETTAEADSYAKGAGTKPASDLAVLAHTAAAAAAAGFTQLAANADYTVIPSTPGGVVTKYMQYRTGWRYETDRPGKYSLPIIYTIVGQ